MSRNSLDVVNVRLVKGKPLCSEKMIATPTDAVSVVAEEIAEYDREVFCIININSAGQPVNLNIVSMGGLCSASIQMREVFKASILSNAAAVIAVHNHPSGNLTPSKDDKLTTERLTRCGDLLGIPVLDSIICGARNSGFMSFAEVGIMEQIRSKIRNEKGEERGER